MLSIEKWSWEDLAAMAGVLGALLASMQFLARAILARNFVSHGDHVAMGVRITSLEQRVGLLATKTDTDRIEGRLSETSKDVAVTRAELQGVRETMQRTERMVGLLVEHQLGEGSEK